jgi:NACalpha-BTF3-like transcription factor
MKLVSSNESSFVKGTIEAAMKIYRDKSDVSATLDALCKLKGIGPATASLLLSVHDPEQTIFFSDEAFWWLCCNGKKDTIKYNAKEYKALNAEAQKVVKRLGVKATDVEKVAYVVMKQEEVSTSAARSKTNGEAMVKEPLPKPEAKKQQKSSTAKRKQSSGDDREVNGPVRRSKRGKAS